MAGLHALRRPFRRPDELLDHRGVVLCDCSAMRALHHHQMGWKDAIYLVRTGAVRKATRRERRAWKHWLVRG